MHITQIKDFFKLTNLKKIYEKQILDHNIKKFNLIIINNMNVFFCIKILTNVDKNAILYANSINGVKNIIKNLK